MSPPNARMKSTSLSFRRSGVQSHATLGSARAIQSERSLRMVFWLALREKRSECFLRLVGPYSFGKHLVLEFHGLLQLFTECLLHEPLGSLHRSGGLCSQSARSFSCCRQKALIRHNLCD